MDKSIHIRRYTENIKQHDFEFTHISERARNITTPSDRSATVSGASRVRKHLAKNSHTARLVASSSSAIVAIVVTEHFRAAILFLLL